MADKPKKKASDGFTKNPPRYSATAGQRVNPQVARSQNQVREFLKRTDPGKHADKNSLLFNLSQEDQEAVLSGLTPQERKKFRGVRDKYTGDRTPDPGMGGRYNPAVSDVGDIYQGFYDRLAPLMAKDRQDFIRASQEANLTERDTPEGKVKYVRDPVTGRITEQTILSPEMQSLYDAEMAGDLAGNKAAQDILQGYKYQAPPSFDRQSYEDQVYQGFTRDITPRQAQEQESFRQRMSDMGLAPGGEGYDAAYRNFVSGQQEELRDARDRARLASGQEASDALSRWGMQNQVPIQTAQGLYGIGAGSRSPGSYGAPQVSVPFTDMFGTAVNVSANQNQLGQQQNQFVNQFNMDAWKTKYAMDQAAKAGGGGGGGGAPPGYTFEQLMAMGPEYSGQAQGGYQPSPQDQALGGLLGGLTQGAINAMGATKSYPQYAGKSNFSSGLFGNKGLFG